MISGQDEPAFAAPVLGDKQFQAKEQVGGTVDFVEDDRTRVETQKAFGVLLEYLKCGKVIECERCRARVDSSACGRYIVSIYVYVLRHGKYT